MTDNEIVAFLTQLNKSDRYTIQKTLQMFDGRNIQLGTGTGTIIGTATNQKLGFFGHAPAAQQTASATAASILALLQTYGLSG